MNKYTKLLPALFSCLFLLNKAYSQQPNNCSTPEMNQKLFDANPALRAEYMKEEQRLEALDKEAYANGYKDNSRTTGTIYRFPVVFHIIHNNGPENISDAQIMDALQVLNDDFRKKDAAFSTTDPAFQSLAVDAEIEFCLATKDPSGKATTGIDRIVSTLTNNAGDPSRLNPWNTNMYLNIWTVASLAGGSSGYTYYPTSAVGNVKDGVLIQSNYVGSIGTSNPRYSYDLPHEVGHYFNLLHVFEGGSTTVCGDDGVTDTPPSKQHNWVANCPPAKDMSCSGTSANVNNYMDYSFCCTMFTPGQKTRMQTAITGSNSRKNLWTTANLVATGCSVTTGLSNELSAGSDFNIYPNPLEDNSVIKFNLIEKQKTEINIYNVMGQQVASVFQGELNSGAHEYPIGNKNALKPGIYFVKLTVGDQNFIKKMIVK